MTFKTVILFTQSLSQLQRPEMGRPELPQKSSGTLRWYLKIHKDCETPGQLQGSKTLKPEIPRKRAQKLPPRAPTPNFLKKTRKNTKKYSENTISRVFLVFFEFSSRNLVSGPGGEFLSFFRGVSGSGFWIPVAGRAFLNTKIPLQ